MSGKIGFARFVSPTYQTSRTLTLIIFRSDTARSLNARAVILINYLLLRESVN